MSNAGVFTIVTNDGKPDQMILATELLRKRLAEITRAREANPSIIDKTPTLMDIERTHILYTNSTFKPFAAIGFEYSRAQVNSGTATLGSNVQFSIPQFGDFFHDMVLYVELKQPTLTSTASNESDQPLMRWCSHPGERLVEKYDFSVTGNPLDEYYDHDVNFHRKLCVGEDKSLGWKRMMGQEVPEEGFLDQPNWEDSGVGAASIGHRVKMVTFAGDQTPTGQKTGTKKLLIPILLWFCRNVRHAMASVAIPQGQRYLNLKLCTGNKLVGVVPRGSGTWESPNGTLNYDNMIQRMDLYINNLFVNPEVHTIYIKRIGFTLIRVHRYHKVELRDASGHVHLNNLKWATEALFVGVRPLEYCDENAVNIAKNLDKWDQFHRVDDTQRVMQGWRQNKVSLKDDSLTIAAGSFNNDSGAATDNVRYTSTTAAAVGTDLFNGISAGDLLTFTLTAATTAPDVAEDTTLILEVAQVIPDNDADGTSGYIVFKMLVSELIALPGFDALGGDVVVSGAGLNVAVSRQDSTEASCTVPVATEILDSVTLLAHGIKLYDALPALFHNSYIPYQYGGDNIRVPEDIGAWMFTWALFPGAEQPSGHFNISRSREFYLDYVSSVISTSFVCRLYVSAVAINFLLISDGAAIIRYST